MHRDWDKFQATQGQAEETLKTKEEINWNKTTHQNKNK